MTKFPPLPELIAELNRVRKISADNITNTPSRKSTMSRLSLAETKGRLKDYLLDAGNRQAPVLPMLAGDFGLSAKSGSTFITTLIARLIEALETVYERTWFTLGDQDFYQSALPILKPAHLPNVTCATTVQTFPITSNIIKQKTLKPPNWRKWTGTHIAFDAPNVTHPSRQQSWANSTS